MGRSEPGGEKEGELARMATMVIAAGRREGRQANDWRTFNEKIIKQAYLYKTCVKQNTQETTSAREFLSLTPEEIWGVCTRWPPVRLGLSCSKGEYRYPLNKSLSSEKHNAFSYYLSIG